MSLLIRNRNKQKGLSLVELLIAMMVGLFLLVGITSSYLSSKKSSVQREEYSLLQDNGRLALEIMSKVIEHTGYTSFPAGSISPSSFITKAVVSATCKNGDESVVAASISKFPTTFTDDGSSGGSDSIGVIYLGDDNIFSDCAGEVLPTECRISSTNTDSDAAKIYSSFFVEGGALQCAGSRTATKEIIAEDIENLQILYGVNIDADPEVDRYINATQVGAFTDNIVSVQIAILVRSSREVKDSPESIEYSLLDSVFTAPNDRFLRAVFTTTISLRNTL